MRALVSQEIRARGSWLVGLFHGSLSSPAVQLEFLHVSLERLQQFWSSRWSSFLCQQLLQLERLGESGLFEMVEYPDELDEDDGSSSSGEMASPVGPVGPFHKSMAGLSGPCPCPCWRWCRVWLASILLGSRGEDLKAQARQQNQQRSKCPRVQERC